MASLSKERLAEKEALTLSVRNSEKLLLEWSLKFNVQPPDIRFSKEPIRGVKAYIGMFYPMITKAPRIIIDRNYWFKVNAGTRLELLAHEFAHHIQYERCNRDWECAFPEKEMDKPHNERSWEIEADHISAILERENGEKIDLLELD